MCQAFLGHCNSHFFHQITFKYGSSKNVRLTWDNEYEIVEKLKSHEKPWTTIPEQDLIRIGDTCASLEVEFCHVLLKDNVNIMVPPDSNLDQLLEVLSKHMNKVLPIIIYTVSENILTDSVSFFFKFKRRSFHSMKTSYLSLLFMMTIIQPLSE